jgi:cell shape-determining protein MreC
MIDPEEYRDLVEENTMLRKELKAAKEELLTAQEENSRLKEAQRWPEDSEDIGPCAHWDWPGG